ncbi:hypothetical protein CIHG_05048 [Coccidioides immitis H538.4]|uniref:Uncharacterized protein n=1 Tax=Coccidioides immitis H538.4 TaxID=396776 RepID=A0A0J8UI45_COCIT|nr:hypothetical protein CIHG_05048 [Coccidioides immitis H538.4]
MNELGALQTNICVNCESTDDDEDLLCDLFSDDDNLGLLDTDILLDLDEARYHLKNPSQGNKNRPWPSHSVANSTSLDGAFRNGPCMQVESGDTQDNGSKQQAKAAETIRPQPPVLLEITTCW